MKKHAMLIMAHNQFEILEKLLIMLDHERNDIYIHIDRKSGYIDEEYFKQLCIYSRVSVIPRRRLYWGHSSLVECELDLMEAALASGEEYCYFHLLSGVDLQIKHTEEIHQFFDEHPNQQFIALRNVYSGLEGLNRYYFFLPLRSYSKVLAKGLDILSAYIQKVFRVNRLNRFGDIPLCKCQQWFSITQECARYVVSQREWIQEFIRFTCCSDEMFLGTVIINSEFKNQIYHPYRSLGGHMRLIDRERPEGVSPHTLTMEDWDMIEKCPYFWARKFDMKRDAEVIEKIFEKWRPKTGE